jgi:HEAT repeat protein/type 1 glutamine amidotransferase
MRRYWLGFIVLVIIISGSSHADIPPPRRDIAEVRAVLAQAPKPPVNPRPLTILLVANRKDHGPHEHDYPRWMERWKVLLGGKQAGSGPVNLYGPAAQLPQDWGPGGVKVETANDWPTADQLARADLVVAFMGTGGIWNEAKLRDLNFLLHRGAGFVALHSAVIAEKLHAQPLADLLGLAWESDYTLFRHGPLDLKVATPDNPITKGLPERIHFEDETYWPLVGDSSRVTVLGTAEEPGKDGKLAPQPMFWTHTVGKGRVFNSILGHYTWTFDDPYFRVLVLRGMAWAAGESPYRFDPLVLVGARTTDQKAVAAAKPPVAAPVAPDAKDPNLLLWLDASDPATVTKVPDGRVSAWANRAKQVGGKLTSAGAQQPVYVLQGLGGRPALRFDGVDDLLRNTSFGQSAQAWTVAIVTAPRSNAGQFRALLATNRPGQNDYQSGFNIDLGPGETSAFISINLEGIKAGGAANLRTESAPFGEGQIILLSTGEGSSRLWVNGTEEEARPAGDAATVMDELRLGGRFYLGQERGFFHGDISEVLIYRTPLSDAQRAGLTAHLLQKYGLNIKQTTTVVLDPWDYLPAYDWGATRKPLAPIDEAVAHAQANPKARMALEAKFIEVLADPANTTASKDFACRRLAIIGSAASMPTLAKLLSDQTLSNMACIALERIPDAAAEQALRQALSRLPAKLRVGVIDALGNRRSQAAVGDLAPLLADQEVAVREAAAAVLGKIGGPASAKALTRALDQTPAPARVTLAESCLRIAEQFRTAGQKAEALTLYERLRKPDVDQTTRVAATRGTILLRGTAGVPLLLEQLQGNDSRSQVMALLLIRHMEGSEVTRAIASQLGSLPPDKQAQVITTLADRNDPVAKPAILKATRSNQSAVRLAAVQALGRLGDVSDVPVLLELAGGSEKEIAAAAVGSLAALPGKNVDASLLQSVDRGDTRSRRAAIDVLGRRAYAPATVALIKHARGTEPSLRVAATQALGETASVGDVPTLVEILVQAKDPSEAEVADTALTAVYARIDERERWADALIAGLPKAQPAAKIALLQALSHHGGPKALQAVKAAVADPNPEVQDAAVMLLSDWATTEPADDLLAIARQSSNRTHRILALRGYLRMAGQADVPPSRRVAMCQVGLRLATRDDERRLALTALAGVPTAEALAVTLPFLSNANLKEEAGAAAVAIGQKLLPNQAASVAEAMDKVLKVVTSMDLLRQATELRWKANQMGR